MQRFDEWNEQKKVLNKSNEKIFFHEREVWFLKMGENVGFEQNGKGNKFLRPVLVYKRFSRNVFLGIPLTSSLRNSKFYFTFELKGRKSTAILSQIRLFDKKRFFYFYAKVSEKNFKLLKKNSLI